MSQGHHYGGSFEFVTYSDANNKIWSLTIIAPFMSNTFNEPLEGLASLPSKVKYKGKLINNPSLENRILLLEKKTIYLPKIEQPPTVKELLADPPR